MPRGRCPVCRAFMEFKPYGKWWYCKRCDKLRRKSV